VILSILVAVAENGVIGREGRLPWHLPDDLRRFKRLTTGHAIVMGRRTCESIGRALPGRRSIVLSRDPRFTPSPGIEVARSLDAAIAACVGEEEVFVIGGESLFREALPRADRVYLTRVHGRLAGDVLFPDFDETAWDCVERDEHAADERHEHPFTFLTYRRRA
jgi:dihydrofolate reductase